MYVSPATAHASCRAAHGQTHVAQHGKQLVAELHVAAAGRLQLVCQHCLLAGRQLGSHLSQRLQPLSMLLDGSTLRSLPAAKHSAPGSPGQGREQRRSRRGRSVMMSGSGIGGGAMSASLADLPGSRAVVPAASRCALPAHRTISNHPHLASRSLNPWASTGHRWSGLSAPPARCSASRHCSSSTPAGFARAAGLSTTLSSRCWKR